MIHLSPTAIAEVKRLCAKQPAPKQFRLSVAAGGCAEYYYHLSLVEQAAADDRLTDCDGLSIAIAADSLALLDRLKLDYSEDLMGGSFQFDNPNAVSHCGCGNSFTLTHAPIESDCL